MPDIEMQKREESSQQASYEKRTYDDPEDQIWSVYDREAEKMDLALVERWKGDMDGLLIFAGLFSAVITAFIIESYKTLNVDSGDATVALLTQISLQLAASANGSQLSLPIQTVADIASFTPTSSAVRVNMCWFLSLVLSLATALAATLVQQWSRQYSQTIQRREIPRIRARVRCFLYGGVEQFHLTTVVEAVPALLHVALFLFLDGLVEFLIPLDHAIGYVILSAVVACGALYATISILPVFLRNCPYRSSLTAGLWFLYRLLYLVYDPTNTAEERDQREFELENFLDAQEKDALLVRTGWPQREAVALKWTLHSVTDQSEVHPFFEGIPGYLDSEFIGSHGARMECLKDLFADGTMVLRLTDTLNVYWLNTRLLTSTQRVLATLKVAFLMVRFGTLLSLPRDLQLFTGIDKWCWEVEGSDPLVQRYAHLIMTLSLPLICLDSALDVTIFGPTSYYHRTMSFMLRNVDEAQQALATIQDPNFRKVAAKRDVAGLALIIHVGYLLVQPQLWDSNSDISGQALDCLFEHRSESASRGDETEWTPKVDHLVLNFCARLAGLDPDTLTNDPNAKVEVPMWIELKILMRMLDYWTLSEGEHTRAITILENGKFHPDLSNTVDFCLQDFKRLQAEYRNTSAIGIHSRTPSPLDPRPGLSNDL